MACTHNIKNVEVLGWIASTHSKCTHSFYTNTGRIRMINSCLQFRLLCCCLLQGNNDKQYTTLRFSLWAWLVRVHGSHDGRCHKSDNVIRVLGVLPPGRWISRWPRSSSSPLFFHCSNLTISRVTKNVEVPGWVRNLVRIAGAFVLFIPTLAE